MAMIPYYEDSAVTLYHGDCREVLPLLGDNSVDAVVTDPPYGLSFMSKKWDYDVPSVGIWREVLRVLKPGGHLLSFGGTRTYHRMVVNIEDAGFEVRDQVGWMYGSGFPKSLNVGNGFGTALKPAWEPIVLARKPLSEKTIAANVLKWGTGAINIDECRVDPVGYTSGGLRKSIEGRNQYHGDNGCTQSERYDGSKGRWPANVIHDGSPEVLAEFAKYGERNVGNPNKIGGGKGAIWNDGDNKPCGPAYADTGTAARFFYAAKASRSDRSEGNSHPTVKPCELMKYLCRMITPPGGVILDPFMGSGSTGKGAIAEGFGFIGIEREAEYLTIAQRRIATNPLAALETQYGRQEVLQFEATP